MDGWFPRTRRPYKTKGFAPPGFHTLHPCLRSHGRRHQSPRVPRLRIPAAVEPASNRPHLQWIRGAALTSPSSTWKASSIKVFSTRGPRPWSGCCPVRRICRRRLMATWCRSPTSISVGSRPPPIDFFEGCCTTTRSSCSTSIPTGSSTWRRTRGIPRDQPHFDLWRYFFAITL